jgi:hypothetical protein
MSIFSFDGFEAAIVLNNNFLDSREGFSPRKGGGPEYLPFLYEQLTFGGAPRVWHGNCEKCQRQIRRKIGLSPPRA